MTSCDMYLFLQYPFLYHLSSIFYRSDNSRFVKKHLPAYHKEKGVFYACSSFYPALNLFTSCRYRQNTGRYRKSCTGPCHILQHLCRRCSRTGRGLSSSRSEYPGDLRLLWHAHYPTANMPGPPFMTRPLASLISWGDNEKGAFYRPFYVTNTLIINFDH